MLLEPPIYFVVIFVFEACTKQKSYHPIHIPFFLLKSVYFVSGFQMSGLTKNPLASLAALGLAGMAPSNTGGLNPTG